MPLFIGINPGDTRSGSTGQNRGTVTLFLAPDGDTVTLGDRKVTVKGNTLVLWHKGDAGTFHGVRCPVDLRTMKCKEAPRLRVGEALKGLDDYSSSGAGEVAALVIKVERPLAIVTSGYMGRRGWSLTIVSPDGAGGLSVERVDPVTYRARYAAPEEL